MAIRHARIETGPFGADVAFTIREREIQMPIHHDNHAPSGWKTLIVAATGAFGFFMIVWMLYLANSASGQ
ncbi:hypothetical protein MKL01_03030 [Methylobacterium sp. J-070]|nr:hypothetical protein [Methylobacterium sp. J-070]